MGFGFTGGLESDTGQAIFATGNVSGNNNVGGLIGYSEIESSQAVLYATGKVTGTTNVGGLFGVFSDNLGSMQTSFATGSRYRHHQCRRPGRLQ